MKKQKLSISIVVLLLIGVALLSVAFTKSLIEVKNSENTSDYSYNHISVTGTPINNGEFIFGGGTYRDVNLKLKLNIPVGWSIALGGSGNLAENEFESAAFLRIYSNNQSIPRNGILNTTDLLQSVQIDGLYYSNKNSPGLQTPHTSFEDAINHFANSKDEKIISIKGEDFLLANKYKAHKFDIEYKYSVLVEGEDSKNSPMRFRTLIYVDNKDKLYSIDVRNTDFYNSPQVQEMLNSIEFYE